MSEAMKVGKDFLNGKPISYKFTPCDAKGWIDSKKFIPIDYDLVFIQVEGKKKVTGWWNGTRWDGADVNIPDSTPVLWKRNMIEVLDR